MLPPPPGGREVGVVQGKGKAHSEAVCSLILADSVVMLNVIGGGGGELKLDAHQRQFQRNHRLRFGIKFGVKGWGGGCAYLQNKMF